MKRLLVLCLSFFFATTIHASHINGGYISYRYIGNNNYEVTLIVYRDCFNGVPPLDNPAHVGFFDSNNTLFHLNDMSLLSSGTLSTMGDCIPGGICFEKGIYIDTVFIDPVKLPATIAYQRCCRAASILNIFDPGNVGMTFFATVNIIDNSSALFNSEIPGFTFVNDNFVYDASVFDPDGDSLVYSLSELYSGASQSNAQPNPPAPPPYTLLAWQAPYSITNVIGGSTPLSIDPITGMMTAVPGSVGVYQVGEKVDEYRNGSWVTSTHREFQLFINPANYYNLSGNVSVNGNTQPLDVGKLWLIRKNLYDSTLTAIDTNAVTTGNYSFSNNINGIYLLKASADPISTYYANNIPTYFGDVPFWYQATELNLCLSDTQNVNINLVQGVNPGGPGFIGGFISQGANKMLNPVGPLTVILFNSINQPVAYSTTDPSGYFSISNLPFDTYKVYVDKLNVLIDNSVAPTINLSGTNPGSNNFAFTLYSDHLELNGFVNVPELKDNGSVVFIVPNPAKERALLKYSLKKNSDTRIEIYDLFGRKINSINQKNQSAGEHSFDLDFIKEKMKSGVYFINLKTDNFSKTLRITVI